MQQLSKRYSAQRLGESKRAGGDKPERNAQTIARRILGSGIGSVSDAELVALLFCGRVSFDTMLRVGTDLLQERGSLRGLFNAPAELLTRRRYIGHVTVARLHAAKELARRSLLEQLERADALESPTASRRYLSLTLRDKSHEAFYVLFLDSKHRVIAAKEMFRGTIDSTTVPIREVVMDALLCNAAAVIVAHNHPSGNTEPSHADRHLTSNLQHALELISVRLLDHFVVGDGEPVSFAEQGLLLR